MRLAAAMGVLALVNGAGAQENLDRGKSAAQLFASDCSACHKSPHGLARAGGLLGLDSFLRSHYTASRETAGAIASYLRSVDAGPPARATKRSAKPGEAKSAGKKSDAAPSRPSEPKSSEPRPSESRPANILAPETKSR